MQREEEGNDRTRTKYGTGSVYQQKGRGVWAFQFWHNGKRYHRSSGSTERRDAVRMLRAQLKELGRGAPPTTAARRAKFDDLVELLRADYRRKENRSLDRALLCTKHLSVHFGDVPAREIDYAAVEAYINTRLDQGAAHATVKQERAILGRMLKLAVKAELLPTRPPLPEMGESRNIRTGFFEEADFRAIHAELPEPIQPLVEFAYLTGWRKDEVLTLTWRQVDFRAGVVRLEAGATKNDDGRVFPFAAFPDLAALLRRQREATSALERETGCIVTHVFHRHGKPIRSCHEAWVNACVRAGRPGKLMHDFRRTAVRRLERAGVPRSQAKKLVGHRTDEIYDRYTIVAGRDLEDAVAKIAAQLAADRCAVDSAAPITVAKNTVHEPSTAATSRPHVRTARTA